MTVLLACIRRARHDRAGTQAHWLTRDHYRPGNTVSVDWRAPADNYLRQQSGELGWIQFALRGPALWAAALALALSKPNRPIVTAGWMEDQLNFFGKDRDSGKTRDNRRIAWHSIFLFQVFLFARVLVSSALAVMG
jgi:hypothetical protein